jgi:ABC-type glycerol-3-phosphate transport system substrate-binding protein
MIKKKPLLITAIVILILAGALFVWNLWRSRPADLLSQLENDEAPQERFAETTLTFLFIAPKPQATQAVIEQVERKLKNTLNIKLNFTFSYTIPRAQGNNSSSQTGWDVLYYQDDSESPLDFKTLVKEGKAQDITAEFPRLAPNYYRSLSPEELNTAMVDGKIYAIPPHFYAPQIMRCAIVREDLMAKYQIPAITNYDGYEEYLRIIKTKEPKLFPVVFYDTAIGLFAEANGYAVFNYELGLVYPLGTNPGIPERD